MRPDDVCATPDCGHRRLGSGPSEGHFLGHRNARASEGGPCKVPQCGCRAFRARSQAPAEGAKSPGNQDGPVHRMGISRWSKEEE